MEAILLKPRNKKELIFFRDFFKKTGAIIKFKYKFKGIRTIERMIIDLYQDGHYDDDDIEWFFSIPKEFRINPFDISPSGDIFYADKRNIDKIDLIIEENKIEKKKGNYVVLEDNQSIWDLV